MTKYMNSLKQTILETSNMWFQKLSEALPILYKNTRNRKFLTELCQIKLTKPEFDELRTAFVYITDQISDFVYDVPMGAPQTYEDFLEYMKQDEGLYFVLSNDGCGIDYKYHTEQFYIDLYFDKFIHVVL